MIIIWGDWREGHRRGFDDVTLQCWALLDWSSVSGMGWLSVQEKGQPACVLWLLMLDRRPATHGVNLLGRDARNKNYDIKYFI